MITILLMGAVFATQVNYLNRSQKYNTDSHIENIKHLQAHYLARGGLNYAKEHHGSLPEIEGYEPKEWYYQHFKEGFPLNYSNGEKAYLFKTVEKVVSVVSLGSEARVILSMKAL